MQGIEYVIPSSDLTPRTSISIFIFALFLKIDLLRETILENTMRNNIFYAAIRLIPNTLRNN